MEIRCVKCGAVHYRLATANDEATFRYVYGCEGCFWRNK